MKKQTKTYLLLGLVLLIWGIIGYRVIGALSPKIETSSPLLQDRLVKPKKLKKKDTFSLVANYRDPFLGTLPASPKKKKAKKIVPRKPEPEILIEYTGLVQDKDTREKIFFLTIGGKPYLLSPGDKVQMVTLLSGTPQEVRVRANKKNRTIPLKS